MWHYQKNYLLNTNSKSYPCFTIHKISINQHQSASNSVKQHRSTSICRERQKETEINIMGKYCKQQHLKYLQENCPSCPIKRKKEKTFGRLTILEWSSEVRVRQYIPMMRSIFSHEIWTNPISMFIIIKWILNYSKLKMSKNRYAARYHVCGEIKEMISRLAGVGSPI